MRQFVPDNKAAYSTRVCKGFLRTSACLVTRLRGICSIASPCPQRRSSGDTAVCQPPTIEGLQVPHHAGHHLANRRRTDLAACMCARIVTIYKHQTPTERALGVRSAPSTPATSSTRTSTLAMRPQASSNTGRGHCTSSAPRTSSTGADTGSSDASWYINAWQKHHTACGRLRMARVSCTGLRTWSTYRGWRGRASS